MSRIGKLPVEIPSSVEVTFSDQMIFVSGEKGKVSEKLSSDLDVSLEDSSVVVKPLKRNKKTLAMWGTTRSIIRNMVHAVQHFFKKELKITGVGYKAEVKNGYLNLSLGKSHSTKIFIPSYVEVEVPSPSLIHIYSIDKVALGNFCFSIMKQRKVEPFKGKGIAYNGIVVKKKEGKKSK